MVLLTPIRLVALSFFTLFLALIPFRAESDELLPLRVGVIAPLTGVAADFGQAVRNSIQLALEDNQELAKRATFIFEDVPYDAKQAVSAFQNLVRAKKVDLVFIWGVIFCNPLAPLAEAMRIPVVVQCVHPEAARDRRYVIRFINVSDQYASATTRYLKQQRLDRIAALVADNPYTEEILAALQRNLQPGQTLHVVDRFNQSTMDFRAVISKIKRSDAQVTAVLLSSGQIAAYYRQRREQHDSKPTFGANTHGSISEIKAAAGSMDGAVFAANEVSEDFINRHTKQFGHASQIGFGALAYEFAQSLGRILVQNSQLSGDQLMSAFERLPRQESSVAGPYQLRSEAAYGRFFDFPVVMQRIEGEGFRALEPSE